MNLTVVHVVASTRAEHGGPSRSVPALCAALTGLGVEVHLVTASSKTADEHKSVYSDADFHVHPVHESGILGRTLRSPVKFYRRVTEVVSDVQPDLIHDHGAWLPSNVVAAWIAHRADIPLVTAPRGMMTEWALAHRSVKKRIAWHLYQRWVFEQTAVFHATASSEADRLRDLGFSQPVAVIANGIHVPGSLPERQTTDEKRALFLSRLHPKKGLPMLLEAWAQVRPDEWTLELVGPSENGHRAVLEQQARTLGIQSTVAFSGAVNDAEKWQKYVDADVFVLPSHSENFGIVVGEALGAGLPVITTTGTPWEELETHGCGWWVEPQTEAVKKALADALSQTDDERVAMGARGRGLVESTYRWQAVGKKMTTLYRWVTGKVAKPDNIEFLY